MSWIDILGQNTGERGATFPQISTGIASYWEEFEKMEILTLIEYDLEGPISKRFCYESTLLILSGNC